MSPNAWQPEQQATPQRMAKWQTLWDRLLTPDTTGKERTEDKTKATSVKD
jgi:hypothetical protein